MLTGSVRAWVARVPGGMDGLAEDLLAERSRGTLLGDPQRPSGVEAGRWRRMSRMARFAVEVTAELLEGCPDVDRASVPLVYGSAMGEVVPSSTFLDRLFTEGPGTASPLAFQNSVTNATAAHVSMALGLRGPSETVSTGLATGLAALARGMEHLIRSSHVLVVLADDVNPTTLAACAHTDALPGEIVLALLLEAGDSVRVDDGPAPPGVRCFHRSVALPYEDRFQGRSGIRPERVFGVHCAGGLVGLLATDLPVMDQDDGCFLTATRVSHPSGGPKVPGRLPAGTLLASLNRSPKERSQ